MWKRRPSEQKEERQGSTSDKPTLVPSADKPLPKPTTDLSSGGFSLNSRPAFGRKETGEKELPGLPDSSQTTPAIRRRPVSTVATASSVYSQPSPEFDSPMTPTSTHLPRSSSIYPEDISPPDSPMGHSLDHGHNRDSSFNVSPISTEAPTPFSSRSPTSKQSGTRYNSNLPVPKKNTKKFWKLPDKSSTSPDADATPATVRWDEYSGEPTSSEKGKPPSTTPGEVKLHEDPTPGRLNTHNFGTSTHISGGSIARKRVGSREVHDAPIQMRPQWKGAGGRHAIVPPPIDKPLPVGQSPKFPMGQQKKQQIEDEERADRESQERERLEREQAEQEKLEAERTEQRRAQEEMLENQRREQKRAEQVRIDRERDEEERKTRERVVQARRERDLAQQAQRAKDAAAQRQKEQEEAAQRAQRERDQAEQRETQAAKQRNGSGMAFDSGSQDSRHTDHVGQPKTMFTASNGSSSDSLSISTDKRSPLARNPSREEMQVQDRRAHALPGLPQQDQSQHNDPKTPSARDQRPEWKPRTSSLPSDNPEEQDPSNIESKFRAHLQNMTIPEEPKSRFSTTTYATTAYNDSPPLTPEMGSGNSPSLLSTSTTPNSILNRRRPIPPSGVPNAKPDRKPTPSEMVTPTSVPNYAAESPTASDSDQRSKVLPKAPAGQPKVDQVQTLQAKQDALRRRKHNIETVIHELTDVVQPSSIAYDKASRQEIKKTVEQLKKELAEVIKDEHETGLKLHRAWKRHEDFADFEPTSIWVRRVTH